MNGPALPLVSIITPVYNGSRFLEPLISSILEQDYPKIEHIIIDDGSTDEGATLDVIKKFSHLRWWTRPNRGQYASMNEGLLAAKGEIICFICADDIMTPGAVSTAVDYLANHPDCGGVYGNYSFINSDGMKLNLFQPIRLMPTKIYPYSLHISHSSLYIRKFGLVQNDLLFAETYKHLGDYLWIVRILRSKLKLERIKNVLSTIRIHDQQTSKIGFYGMRKEMAVIQKELGISLFGASVFRKLWFILNLVNAAKLNGINSSLMIVRERLQMRSRT